MSVCTDEESGEKLVNKLLRAPSRRSASVNVPEHASLGLPGLGALATLVDQVLYQAPAGVATSAAPRAASARAAAALRFFARCE